MVRPGKLFPVRKIYTGNDFKKGVTFSPAQLIQGKVSGLTIMNMTGHDQNPRMQFHFRGASTMFYDTDPLYVINGIPVANVDFIMPENIESIEVAGNLSEAAGYGTRGSNGVISINTLKTGKQKFALSYSNCFFIERMSKKSDYLSPFEFRQIKTLWGSASEYSAAGYYSRSLDDFNSSTDWIREITQEKISQQHNLSLNGNHKNTAYSLSLSFRDYNGMIKKNESDIYSGQISISQHFFRNRLSLNLASIWSIKEFSDYNTNPILTSQDQNIFVFVSRYNPTVAVYDSVGDYTIPVINGYRTPNPLSRLYNALDSRKIGNFLTSIKTGYKIIDGLEFSALFARNEMNKEFFFSRTYSISNGIINDEINETQNYDQNFLKTNLSYIKKLQNHHIELLISFSVDDLSYKKDYSSNVPVDLKMVRSSHYIFHDKTRQIFVNGGYAFRNKYIISAGILSERAAIFPVKPSTNKFPSYKAGWILSNEKFLGDPDWLEYFELFTEYGKSRRNVNLSNYDDREGIGDEILKEHVLGMKMILLNKKVSLLIERYNKITDDGIWIETIPLPLTNQTYKFNAMEIRNRGWEFSARLIPIRKEELRWISDFNLSVNKNRVLSDIVRNSLEDRFGAPVGMIIGNRFAGFNSEDIMLVYDSADNPVFAADYEYLENSIPTLYFGFTNNFVFKNFDISFFLRGASGHYIHIISRYDLQRGYNIKKDLITADRRIIGYGNTRPNIDYLLEKGSFIKTDNVMLGYTIYPRLWKINKLRLFLACNNLATLTKFSGWDPEMVPISGANAGKYKVDQYPVTRIFSAGLKIEL